MSVDTSKRIALHVRISWKYLGVATAVALAFAALCFVMAFSLLSTRHITDLRENINWFVGWTGVIVTIWIWAKVLKAYLTRRTPVLVLGPEGFHHYQSTKTPIAWPMVERISRYGRYPMIVVSLSEAAWTEIPIYYESKLLRLPNRIFSGMDGIYIALFKPRESMIGSAEELFTAFCSYAKAHGGKVG